MVDGDTRSSRNGDGTLDKRPLRRSATGNDVTYGGELSSLLLNKLALFFDFSSPLFTPRTHAARLTQKRDFYD